MFESFPGHHGDAEIVSREASGALHRTTYGAMERRARRLARALTGLGVQPGDRVAIEPNVICNAC